MQTSLEVRPLYLVLTLASLPVLTMAVWIACLMVPIVLKAVVLSVVRSVVGA